MNGPIYILIVLISLVAHTLCPAQDLSALDHFNRASKEYIQKDKLTALKTLDAALREYPGDARLLKLAEELLKEEEQQQQEEQQEQQNEKNEQEKNEQGQDQGSDKKQEEQQEEQQGKGSQKEPQEKRDPAKADQEQPEPGTIAPQDARRMLDAVDQQERDIQEKVRTRQRPVTRIPIDKDW